MLFKDQMLREVRLEEVPTRIVSLVPSQTELLHDLGLEDQVVGITKFCLHPDEWFRNKPRVGGTKKVDFTKVRKLSPDLIIGNKEENEKSDIEHLVQEYPVWMSDIFDLEDALMMIQQVGEVTGSLERAQELISVIKKEFKELDSWVSSTMPKGKTAAYFIWSDPNYCAGKNTFIDAMLNRCGLENYVNEARYPEFKESASTPDFVFLSSEPFPFKEKHIQAYQDRFPSAKVVLVDGEMFSWYGSRLAKAPGYFKKLLEELIA
ncbi:MAG: ABC transporter substrate-binding protein [Fluviicola sp.]